ncbi:DUF6115 domain-containing protein [Virgibacillus sp. CBA3643]|uniref:DUF6115 domain-containing protein n=1 Tax=Virgibacillus sp. CBA3643 TaxID=2942278 RepID=UPI0035A3879F
MVSFVLIISFILHIVALLTIYQLFRQVQKLKQANSSELMELFEIYLQEIRDENSRLQQGLTPEANEELTVTQTARKMEHELPEEYHPPEVWADDRVETSLPARILKFHKEGFSETEIARKLNCGKTEVRLIIKLHA